MRWEQRVDQHDAGIYVVTPWWQLMAVSWLGFSGEAGSCHVAKAGTAGTPVLVPSSRSGLGTIRRYFVHANRRVQTRLTCFPVGELNRFNLGRDQNATWITECYEIERHRTLWALGLLIVESTSEINTCAP